MSSAVTLCPICKSDCDITEEDLIDADCGACGSVTIHVHCKEKYCRQQGASCQGSAPRELALVLVLATKISLQTFVGVHDVARSMTCELVSAFGMLPYFFLVVAGWTRARWAMQAVFAISECRPVCGLV